MNERQPSRTALGAAGYRAAHQLLEGGKVFSDPLARTILGDGADAIIAGLSAGPAQQRMRIFMAARSRFAEDCLGVAVSRGVRQAVVLGAGFDPVRPAFFMWLGVVPYLGRAAIAATLRYIASVPESEVVFDYSEPLENYPPERRA